jgi:hypothetical protein
VNWKRGLLRLYVVLWVAWAAVSAVPAVRETAFTQQEVRRVRTMLANVEKKLMERHARTAPADVIEEMSQK